MIRDFPWRVRRFGESPCNSVSAQPSQNYVYIKINVLKFSFFTDVGLSKYVCIGNVDGEMFFKIKLYEFQERSNSMYIILKY